MKHIFLRAMVAGGLALAFGFAPAGAVLPEVTIYQLQQDQFTLGDSCLIDSVIVIGVDIRTSTFGVYVQEPAGGAYSGILAYRNTIFPAYDNSADAVQVGDLVNVRGRYADFAGLAELDNPTLNKLGTVTPLSPVLLPIDSLKTNYAGSERWEGVLVRTDSVRVTSVDGFRTWRFHHFVGPLPGRVDSLAAYEKMISGQIVPEVGDLLRSVTGVHDWAFSERRIAPRNDNDIVFISPAPAAVPNLAYCSRENQIKIRFNVALNQADAQTPSKYTLNHVPPLTVTSAVYTNATKTVLLTLSGNMVPSTTPLTVSMSGIRNYQGTPMNDPQTISMIAGIPTIQFVQTPKGGAGLDSSQVVNQQVSIRGVVTETTSNGPGSDFPASIGGFYVQQRGATQYGGIFVFGAASLPVKNDSVFVTGTVIEFGVGPETEITSVDEVTVLGANRPPIQPPAVTLANASGTNPTEGEKYEGMLIKIAGATVISNAFPPGPGSPFDISQSLAGGDTLRVDDLAIEESAYEPWRGDVLDVIGIVRYSGTLPYRRLQPRNWNEPPVGDIHVISRGNVSDAPPGAGLTRLLQNRPNPFNPTTEIEFTLAAPGRVALRVYDVNGKLVATLRDEPMAAGPHSVRWNGVTWRGEPAPTGVYLYRLVTADRDETRKMILLK